MPTSIFELKKTKPKETRALSGRVSRKGVSSTLRRTSSHAASDSNRFQLQSIGWVSIPLVLTAMTFIFPSMRFSDEVQYNLIWVLIALCGYSVLAFGYILFNWYKEDSKRSKRIPSNSPDEYTGLGISHKTRSNR